MSDYAVVRGGGFQFLTADHFLRRAVERCAELERQVQELESENRQLRHHEVARYRTLRRDVSQIKQRVFK